MKSVEYIFNSYTPFSSLEWDDLYQFRNFVFKDEKRIYDRIPGQPTIKSSALSIRYKVG